MGADPGGAGEVGRQGERQAAIYLESLGYRVISRGFLARRGELDLVCRRGERLVLIEVKSRRGGPGCPAEAVGERKRRTLRAAAAEYRALSGWRGPIDFAVVAIRPGRAPELMEEVF